jgi:hypothetical protein
MAINTKKYTEKLLQYYGLNGYNTDHQNAYFGGFPLILYTTAQTRSSSIVSTAPSYSTRYPSKNSLLSLSTLYQIYDFLGFVK